MKIVLLIMIGVSSFLSANFSRNSDGVVSDSKTGLFWQDNYSDNDGSINFVKWTEAINYCEGLSLNGQDDWRLPNIIELLSIVDYDSSNPAISSVFQKTTISNRYWSSTSYGYSKSAVSFSYGQMEYIYYLSREYVRCVRGGQ